ncbi:MAG TPA: hypothetical protein VE733_26180 [Streptosporangiaceae bacterium]|jgi:uncharacterized membrane protein|nr:hypothetical protein [Streptosporangiaceae bacterium]
MDIDQAGRMLADPAAYADEHRLHQALTLLRREAPVHRVEAPGYNPFWAITRHADVLLLALMSGPYRPVMLELNERSPRVHGLNRGQRRWELALCTTKMRSTVLGALGKSNGKTPFT